MHHNSCFISEGCCALRRLLYKVLRVVLFAEWKGSLSAALCCEFTEPLSSLCAVLLKHGENHLNKAGEKWNQRSFSLSLVTQLFLLNSCPTSEVYRFGFVDLVTVIILHSLPLTCLSFLLKLSAEDAERTRDIRWGRWALFCPDLQVTPKGNEFEHRLAHFLQSQTRCLFFSNMTEMWDCNSGTRHTLGIF